MTLLSLVKSDNKCVIESITPSSMGKDLCIYLVEGGGGVLGIYIGGGVPWHTKIGGS